MQRNSEITPLVERGAESSSGKDSPNTHPKQGNGANYTATGTGAITSTSTSTARIRSPPTPAKARLRRLHSAPIKNFLSTGIDVDSLRLSYAAKLVLAAVEGRHVESAVDLLVPKGSFVNPLSYTLYSPILVGIILGHMVLALWEGGMSPFPL
ncbi:unnamed protein product, partial [Ectocarpus fasciculatus]